MTEAHHTRDHFEWSASSTAANWTCSGRMAMLALAGPEKESEHAARGTAAHECAEMALRTGADAISFLGNVIKTKEHEIALGEELTASAQMHVDYVRAQGFTQTMLERRLSLAALDPPFGAGGTCDVIGLLPRMIEVVDLKNGMTIVDVNENKQTRTYALCALLDLPRQVVDGIDRIKVTIVQPRAPHTEGRIRSEEFHIADLFSWAGVLLERMGRSKLALDEFRKIDGNRVLFDEWAEKWLTVGNCSFCPATGFCPAFKRDALKIVGAKAVKWFEEPMSEDPQPLMNAPALASIEELNHWLNGLETLEGWIKALREHTHAMADGGTEFPDWMIVDRMGNRAWREEDETKLAEDIGIALQLPPEEVTVSKVKSVAQIEKALGKRKGELAKLEGLLWSKPVKGTNLVSKTKTTREPAKSKASQFFEEIK